jgi:hypothetical protein
MEYREKIFFLIFPNWREKIPEIFKNTEYSGLVGKWDLTNSTENGIKIIEILHNRSKYHRFPQTFFTIKLFFTFGNF